MPQVLCSMKNLVSVIIGSRPHLSKLSLGDTPDWSRFGKTKLHSRAFGLKTLTEKTPNGEEREIFLRLSAEKAATDPLDHPKSASLEYCFLGTAHGATGDA